MELWQEILGALLASEAAEIRFPQIENVEKLFSDQCYLALCEIKMIIENRAYTDAECFMRIEEILRVFERMGSDSGGRHDF